MKVIKYAKKYVLTILISLSLISCASYRPILDNNQKLKRVGLKEANKEVDKCLAEAEEYLQASKKRRMAKEAGRKSIWGGIFGSVFGFLSGGTLKSAGIGTAIGAGVGAVSGAGGVVAEDKIKPDQIKQRYTSNCLARKGYSIIGWQ